MSYFFTDNRELWFLNSVDFKQKIGSIEHIPELFRGDNEVLPYVNEDDETDVRLSCEDIEITLSNMNKFTRIVDPISDSLRVMIESVIEDLPEDEQSRWTQEFEEGISSIEKHFTDYNDLICDAYTELESVKDFLKSQYTY